MRSWKKNDEKKTIILPKKIPAEFLGWYLLAAKIYQIDDQIDENRREKRIARQRKYYQRNKDKLLERSKEYIKKNYEKCKEYNKKYYHKRKLKN